jgi:hypothetical protein
VFISQHLLEIIRGVDYESADTEVACTNLPLQCNPQQESISIDSTGRRCKNHHYSTSGAQQLPLESHGMNLFGSHPTNALRPTTNLHKATMLDLQLATASTTTKANRANKTISGTADHRSGRKHRSTINRMICDDAHSYTHLHHNQTTSPVDCRICSHTATTLPVSTAGSAVITTHHGQQIAGTATTEPQKTTNMNRLTQHVYYRRKDL